VLAVLLLLAAVVVLRGAYGLRLRLIVIFLALAMVPTLLTIALLWRELQPQAHVNSSVGIGQRMESALVLARKALTDRQDMARLAATQVQSKLQAGERVAPTLLEGLLVQPYVAFVCAGPAGEETILASHTAWAAAESQQFVRGVLPGQDPTRTVTQMVDAPDGSQVVVGIASADHGTAPEPQTIVVLVAALVEPQTADAVTATVENVRRSRQLGILEQLQIHSAGRVLATLALLFIVVAVTLGITLSKTLTRPIRRLQHALEDVTGGDFGRQVSPVPPGELGRLTRSFNTMSADLQASHQQLVQATRLAAWQEVARRLAHEIKNPLTPITLSIHRLRKRLADEDAVISECLDTVLEETSHLERLADEFASFARLPKPQLHAMDAVEILGQVLELYRAHPGLHIETRLAPVPQVLGDRNQLRQVFTNITKNAVESMRRTRAVPGR
jgi:nitrogen fixation/metabolism regulation signal transduction histidine kinase